MFSFLSLSSRRATRGVIAVSMVAALGGLPGCGGPSEVGTVKVAAPKGGGGAPESGVAPGSGATAGGNPSNDPKVMPKGNPRDPANARSIKNRPQ